ncbi:MAG: PAS domain S-box protein [Comamonadaceae bacterium]|nr:PAS domain S-box protein [Comamonadaceae bacterium]
MLLHDTRRIPAASARAEPEDDAAALLRLHRSALDAISQGVLLTDAKRRTTYVNAAFVAMTGYTAADMLGKPCGVLQGPETDPDAVRRMRAALDAGERFHGEVLNYRKDGTPFWNELSIVPVRDERGAVTQYVGVQRDVTLHRQTLHKLTLASKVFEQSNEALAIADVDGRFVAVNRAFTRITGYEEHEAIGQTPRLLKSGLHDEAFYRGFWGQIQERGRWEGEIWNRRKDGDDLPGVAVDRPRRRRERPHDELHRVVPRHHRAQAGRGAASAAWPTTTR